MSQTPDKAEFGALGAPEEHSQHLTFKVGGEMFAIGIRNIREIIEYGNLTTVPMMPEFIRGVLNLRGSVVPVIDLAARFGRTQSGCSRRSCIVILEVETQAATQELGVVVDEVSEVIDIPPSEIEPPPSFGTHIRTDFICGMGKVHGGFVIVLNVQKVLDVDEIATLTGVAETAQRATA